MIQTVVFRESDSIPQIACNKAAQAANSFCVDLQIGREHYVSAITEYQTNFAEGVSSTEYVLTLVVDVDPTRLQQWQELHQPPSFTPAFFERLLAREPQREAEPVEVTNQAF